MRGERGSVLAQVLITSAVASLMCAAILRSRLQPALTTANAVERVRDDLDAQAAVNRVSEVWGRMGACSTDMQAGVRCEGSGCDCRCFLAPAQTGGDETEVAGSAWGGACRLTASRR